MPDHHLTYLIAISAILSKRLVKKDKCLISISVPGYKINGSLLKMNMQVMKHCNAVNNVQATPIISTQTDHINRSRYVSMLKVVCATCTACTARNALYCKPNTTITCPHLPLFHHLHLGCHLKMNNKKITHVAMFLAY